MRLFDAHAHLGDEEELLSRKRENISSLVCAGTPEEAERLMLLCEHSPFSPILLPAPGPSSMAGRKCLLQGHGALASQGPRHR